MTGRIMDYNRSPLKVIRNSFTVDGIKRSKRRAKRVVDEEALQKEMVQPQTYQLEIEAFEEVVDFIRGARVGMFCDAVPQEVRVQSVIQKFLLREVGE
jgi:hypothetical protein